jgi:hypothetical protein
MAALLQVGEKRISVYDLARKHGFVGTERDYLASLRAKS